jgi:hypothetical protein
VVAAAAVVHASPGKQAWLCAPLLSQWDVQGTDGTEEHGAAAGSGAPGSSELLELVAAAGQAVSFLQVSEANQLQAD